MTFKRPTKMLSFKGFFSHVTIFFMLKADVLSFEIEYNER